MCKMWPLRLFHQTKTQRNQRPSNSKSNKMSPKWESKNKTGAIRPRFSFENWQEREDSNPRPLVLETSALARLSYAPAMCGALEEAPTCMVTTLSHAAPSVNFCGAPGGSRTPDARLRTPPLYPLSYRGIMVEIEGLEPSASALRTPRSPN